MTDEEFQKLWMMGMSSERTLGRPKEWDGKDPGFDDFVFKFANWLSGMPGDVDCCELLWTDVDRGELLWTVVDRGD